MFAFAMKIVTCLLVAAAIGFVVAWLLRRNALARAQSEHLRLQSELSASHSALERQRGEHASLGSTHAGLLAEHEARGLSLAESTRALKLAGDGLAEHRTRSAQEIEALRTEVAQGLAAFQAQAGRLNEVQAEAQSQFASAGDKHRAAIAQLATLHDAALLAEREHAVKAARAATATQQSLEAELAQAHTAQAQLTQDLQGARGQHATLAEQLKAALAEAGTAQQQVTTLKALEPELGRAQAETQRLTAQLSPLLALPAALSGRDAQLREVTAARDAASAQAAQLSARVKALEPLEAEVRALREARDAATARATKLQADASQAQARVQSSEQEARAERDAASVAAGQARARIQALEAEVGNVHRAQVDTSKLLSDREAQVAAAGQRSAQFETASRAAEAELKAARTRVEALRAETEAAVAARQHAERAAQQGEQAAALARREHEAAAAQWRSQIQTAQAQLVDCGRERAALEARLQARAVAAPVPASAPAPAVTLTPAVPVTASAPKTDPGPLPTRAVSAPVDKPPRQYSARPAGVIDDLKWIYGVGPVMEKMLHKLGVYFFRQVAQWSEADIDFFDTQLEKFHGRIRRENWVRSATEEHYKKHGQWLGTGEPKITMPETNR